MDRHNVPGLKPKDAAEAHLKDLEIQNDYNCSCITYWIDEEKDSIFCLIESPSRQAVREMHNRAHGLIPHDIIEVDRNVVKAFLGRIYDPDTVTSTKDQVYLNDPAYRYLLIADLKDRILFEGLYGKQISGKLLMRFNSLVQQGIQQFSGRIVESHREFLVSFNSATHAVDCALFLRNSIEFQNTCENLPKVQVQIGINAGFPVAGSSRLFGDTVKKARRFCFISTGNRICVTREIKEQYKGNSPQVFKSSRTIRIFNTDEENFLEQLFGTFYNSLCEPSINMEKFCRELGVSASKLYRNTMLLTERSPKELLQEVRLVTALQLMAIRNKNISETAYELGFTNPSYFSKCFKKRFSILPAEFLKTRHLVIA